MTAPSEAAILLARADKYLNTGSGEYAADIMRDMADYIRRPEVGGMPVEVVAPAPATGETEARIKELERLLDAECENKYSLIAEINDLQSKLELREDALRRVSPPAPDRAGVREALEAALPYLETLHSLLPLKTDARKSAFKIVQQARAALTPGSGDGSGT